MFGILLVVMSGKWLLIGDPDFGSKKIKRVCAFWCGSPSLGLCIIFVIFILFGILKILSDF